MNNKGWGLQTMIILCAVLAIALFISAMIINNTFNKLKNNETADYSQAYKNREAQIKEAAKDYWADNSLNVNDGSLTVTVKTLINKDYLTIIKDPQDNTVECSGYVIINSNYMPYLKCADNYTTSGYMAILDN